MRVSGYHVIVSAAVFVGVLLNASTVQDEEAAIDAVLKKYVDAQGGEERLSTITSLEIEATMHLDSQGLRVATEQKIQSPDKVLTVQQFPGLGRIENRLNGSIGWEWHPIAGERPLDFTEVDELLDDANFKRDLKLREEYRSIRLGEPEEIEGIETVHLVLTDDRGREEHWYFKPNGELFQKIHRVSSGPESEFESTERYYDLETEDGFRFPRRIRYLNPAYEAELRIEGLYINREIDPELFRLPDYAEEMASLMKPNPQDRSNTTVD